MDCEGCEYSLGEDIALEEPQFFQNVDQFPVEVHVSKTWLNTEYALHSLGLLFLYLETAGLLKRRVKKGCLLVPGLRACPVCFSLDYLLLSLPG